MADAEPLAVDALLYPDIAEYGGLADAMQAVAAAEGIGLGELVTASRVRRVAVSALSEHGVVHVGLMVDRRVFSIYIYVDERQVAVGGTDSLQEVVGVAGAWAADVGLRRLGDEFPFLETYEIPDNPIAVSWESHLADPDLTEIRPFLLAARQNPLLRGWMPGVSHLTLARFSSRERERVLDVLLRRDGRYEVSSTWTAQPRIVETVDEAVAEAAAQIEVAP